MQQPKTLRLLKNLVLLLPLPADDKSLGGILFPARYSNPNIAQQFRVIETGPGRRLRDGSVLPSEVSRGDYVLLEGGFEHVTFDNGVKLVDASQIIAKWSLSENVG
jgi:co-chaperonin GroES (HSP10)